MTRVIDFSGRRESAFRALALAGMFAACSPQAAPPAQKVAAAAPVELPTAASKAETLNELEALRAELNAANEKLAEMRARLAESESKRVEREREWLEYSFLLGKVDPQRLPGGKPFDVELPQATAPDASDAALAAPADETAGGVDIAARSAEIASALRTLLRLEQIDGLALLECGTLEGSSIGPVVFRLLDGQGHPAGSLYANHLGLEASRAARSLTLVLKDGYETRAGKQFAFEADAREPGGPNARRIVLEGIDPKTWAVDLRELFGEHGLDLSGDDGLWDLARVKQQLNEVLKLETAGGAYRLRALAGVENGDLLDVHLERLNDKGVVERRLFADRMRIARAPGGVELTLENGVQVRGEDERVPFLDGRYRILLPSADAEVWTRAGIPGLAPVPGTTPATAPDDSPVH